MSEINWYSFPTKICFGADALSKLPEIVAKEKYGKCLIVTDPGFVNAPGGIRRRVPRSLTAYQSRPIRVGSAGSMEPSK